MLLLFIGTSRQKTSSDFKNEVKNLRLAFSDMFVKHKLLARELQSHRDMDAKNKAELRRLKGKIFLESLLVFFSKHFGNIPFSFFVVFFKYFFWGGGWGGGRE